MSKLCTNCHYIGKSKSQLETNFVWLYVSFFVGIVVTVLALRFPILGIGTIIAVGSIIFYLCEYFEGSSACPKCDQITLYHTYTRLAQEIGKINNLNLESSNRLLQPIHSLYDHFYLIKQKICIKCHEVSADDYERNSFLHLGLLLCSFGVLLLPLGYLHPLFLIGPYCYLFLGIILFIHGFGDSTTCSRCSSSTLIHLDTPRAKLILDTGNNNFVRTHPKLKSYLIDSDFSYSLIVTALLINTYVFYRLYIYFSHIN